MLVIVCDECGAILNDGKHGYSTQGMVDDFASMEWWQRVETPEGIRHYCPQHWNAVGDRKLVAHGCSCNKRVGSTWRDRPALAPTAKRKSWKRRNYREQHEPTRVLGKSVPFIQQEVH